MEQWFLDLNPVLQALIATCFTWSLTAVGALPVLFLRQVNRAMFDGILGFAAGVMMAASYWSLLAPAIEHADGDWLPAVSGLLLGGAGLLALDKALPHLHPGLEAAEGPRSHLQRSVLLVLAMTIHNLPEGLAIGVTFAAAAQGLEASSIGGAMALAIGIGLQNLPEGMAVAMPLRGDGLKRRTCLFYGQASGMVEPIGGLIGAAAVLSMQPLLPYALAFAAGAMIYVVIEELIPESHRCGHHDIATVGFLLGFACMMTLDVALG
ncbi:MAG: ZIP family metal transporter [Planctomycetota bacterium]